MDILLRSYETSPRNQEKQPTKNLRRNLNLLSFSFIYRKYQRFFAAAYNNKAYQPFSNQTQRLGLTYCDLKTP